MRGYDQNKVILKAEKNNYLLEKLLYKFSAKKMPDVLSGIRCITFSLVNRVLYMASHNSLALLH